MNQLDRIEAKLTRLLEIAETLLAESAEQRRVSTTAVETATAIKNLCNDDHCGTAPIPKIDIQALNADHDLQSLFCQYPAFREDFYTLDPELEALKGPMGASMLKDATVGMIARSLRMDVEVFVRKVGDMLAQYS